MGQVTLRIAGREHQVACRDGEEHHLTRLGALLERHAETAVRAAGGNPERILLLIALILADRLDELERNPAQGVSPLVLELVADRLEALAVALEEPLP
jgi:cell division protein ZapA